MVQVDFCNPANNETPLASLSFLVHAHLETISRWVDDFEMGAVAVAKKPKAFDVAPVSYTHLDVYKRQTPVGAHAPYFLGA